MKRVKATLEGKFEYWNYLKKYCEQIGYEGGATAVVRNRDEKTMREFNAWLLSRKRDRPAVNAIVGKLPYIDGKPLYGLIRKSDDRTEADYVKQLIADLDNESPSVRQTAREALCYLNDYNLHLTGNGSESSLKLSKKVDREIREERAASYKDILNKKSFARTDIDGLELESFTLADAVDAVRAAKKAKLSKLRKKKSADGGLQ